MDETEEDDATLAARGIAGDRSAFEQLVRRTGRLVYATVYPSVGRADLAEDLTQETFLTAARHLGRLADPTSFRPWLLSIAKTVVIDAARRRGSRKRDGPVGGELATAVDGRPTPAEATEQREQRERALAALTALPEQYRQPLALRYLAGADHDEIGRQLGLTNGSLRGLLHRGLALLRERLGDG